MHLLFDWYPKFEFQEHKILFSDIHKYSIVGTLEK